MELRAGSLGQNAGRRRRHRAILLVALGVAFVASTAAWLATAGVTSPSITPPAGLPSSGAVADVDSTGLSGQVTQSNGNAQLDQGVPITKVIVANGYENKLRVSVGWTNAATAASFLNGKDQISVGLYYPVAVTTSSGSCSSSNALKVLDTQAETSAGGTAGAVCVVLDPATSGSYSLNTATNTIMISQQTIAGYLTPSISATTSAGGPTSTCPTYSSGSPTAWCDPQGTVADTSGAPTHDQHVLYVLASVLNPANHVPPGQQASSGSLDFFTQVRGTP